MGGAVKSVGKAVGNAFSNPIRAATTMMTFGTSELARKTPVGKQLLSMPEKMLGFGGGGPSKAISAPQGGGQQSPLSMLTNSGGAPLLTSISLGANPDEALASYFGVRPSDFPQWLESLDGKDKQAVLGLSDTLKSVQSNTNLRNTAVQNLVNDFPNYMKQAIPQYSSLMDDTTKQMVDSALNRTAAKYAANGGISSGAHMEAAARVGSDAALSKFDFGSKMALQDWSQKYNSATALQSFQQKMLGQGATQGFNAVQNALANNQQVTMQNNQATNQQNMLNQQNENSQSNAMFGALGGLAGSVLGPVGAMAGTAIGNSFFAKSPSGGGDMVNGQSGYTSNPRLNLDRGY